MASYPTVANAQTSNLAVGDVNGDGKLDVIATNPYASSVSLFVGNDDKVFVINVEPNMGAIIGMFLRDTQKERPLTHDLIQSIFKGFSITVERVVRSSL